MNPTNHPSFIFKNLNETLKTLPQYSPFPYHKKCSTLETTLPNKNIKNLVHNCPKLTPRQKLIQTNYCWHCIIYQSHQTLNKFG